MTAILRARAAGDEIVVDRFDVMVPDSTGNLLTEMSLIFAAALGHRGGAGGDGTSR